MKRVFRKIEMRNKTFSESKKRGGSVLFKKLVENRKVRERMQLGVREQDCSRNFRSKSNNVVNVKSRNEVVP